MHQNYSIDILPLESIEGFIWFDGNFIESRNATIHMLTHSFHYGGAVFEGIKSFNGQIFKAREHYERLLESANIMGLRTDYQVDELVKVTKTLLDKNSTPSAYIRPLIFRSTEALMLKPQNSKTHIFIACWEPRKKFSGGSLNLTISNWIKPPPESFPVQCKSSAQYGLYSLAIIDACSKGFDDALFLDKNGYIAECTTSNIFFIQENKLLTPRTVNCLDGITRKTTINISNALGIQVVEKDIAAYEIENMDGAFITGTAVGLREVNSITINASKKSFKPTRIFAELFDKYNKLTGQTS